MKNPSTIWIEIIDWIPFELEGKSGLPQNQLDYFCIFTNGTENIYFLLTSVGS